MTDPAIQHEADDASRFLQAVLSNRDVPCPQCEYNLRDLRGQNCPECGEALVLRVNLAETKQGLLIAGLVGLSAGTGFCGLLVIYIAIQLITNRHLNYRDLRDFFAAIGPGLIIEGPALIAWVRKWRRIRRLSPRGKIGLVLLCWAATLANIIYFSLFIR